MSLKGQEKVSVSLQALARATSEILDEVAGEHVQFAIIIFGEGKDGLVQYVSNAQRDGVKAALKELLDRWEQGGDDGPYHLYRRGH